MEASHAGTKSSTGYSGYNGFAEYFFDCTSPSANPTNFAITRLD